MEKKMLVLGVMGLCVVSVLLMRPIQGRASHEGFAVYEDWSAQTIRSDRWRGIETPGGGQEIKREVSKDRLHMGYRMEGDTSSNSGTRVSANNLNLSPRNPTAIDQIEADFEVASMVVTGCAANPRASEAAAARLNFAKFNDGTSTGPGDRTGDHFAAILARRFSNSADADGILRVVGRLSRCNTATCSETTFSEVNLPQTVKVRDRFTLRLVWDAPNDRFLYGVDANPDEPLSYMVSDAAPAIGPFVSLGMLHFAANCNESPTVAGAEIEVTEVRTNSSAVIP